ncbi:matrix metalloproteinase-16 isoform X2 [Eurytemora carolleeae]|uniref:matrix metalloproteinase-16 isoform X2 n=1 Tax=Eurytemora carolleeae TaxID=1294199 RepID=UPI000C7773BA|nr:matrix metalloproteinase-16 isoform X2 [Eurytemora carolleeae]|eukprot:XP_023340378.1 matrix metalloproteinase-16-like isoform X2 [Eurytemora affinis]
MRKAFDTWSRVTDLKFEEKKSGKVHIEIRFERRAHGDDDAFDGEGGTLAHAFFPVFGGDAHFDEEEDWTVDTPSGTSLLMSAAHELGHSLGLSHSNDRSALMAPFYRGYEKDVSLSSDDIEGIEALYGEKTKNSVETAVNAIEPRQREETTRRSFFPDPPSPPSTTQPSVDNRGLCERGKIDTMVTLQNGTTYAFLGREYWRLTESSIAPGYPRRISEDWAGLPSDLDAAFTWTNGRTYFFKGSRYWRFTDGTLDTEYPKDMSAGFSGIPENVDAAFVWPVNNKIYFFKGSQYWKFDPEGVPPVADSYPRPIDNWSGIPNNLDAAVQYSNGKVYFFKNGKYYRWDDDSFSVDEDANPAFPRDTGFWWFGCKSSPLRLNDSEDIVWSGVD